VYVNQEQSNPTRTTSVLPAIQTVTVPAEHQTWNVLQTQSLKPGAIRRRIVHVFQDIMARLVDRVHSAKLGRGVAEGQRIIAQYMRTQFQEVMRDPTVFVTQGPLDRRMVPANLVQQARISQRRDPSNAQTVLPVHILQVLGQRLGILAKTVHPTQNHPLEVPKSTTAHVPVDTRVLMERSVHRALQAHTRRALGQALVCLVHPIHTPLRWVQHHPTLAPVVHPIHARLLEVMSAMTARVPGGTRARTAPHVLLALPVNIKS
jgi:hypothetical protein